MLSLNDKPMNKDSSVEEIKVIDILHAYKGIQDEDLIELKIQDGKSRDPVMVKLKPSETVSSLIEMYISKKDDSIKFEEVSLIFDGEVLEKKESLKVLDFEGGECIDVVICQMIPEKQVSTPKKPTPKKVTRKRSRRRKQ
uniref:Putative LOC101895653 [Musca domestica] n=2 Tax=Lepeophtheirus salmonis TaxID=72036 RepID=A0A0K2U7U9_LEPSM